MLDNPPISGLGEVVGQQQEWCVRGVGRVCCVKEGEDLRISNFHA